MRAALVQISSSDDPARNLVETSRMVRRAAAEGADFVLTPEVTNIISTSRQHQQSVLHPQDDDPTLAGLRDVAAECGLHLLIGSLALKTGDSDQRFANRSFMIAPDGRILAQYDKIHMFDVDIDKAETFRESAGFRPGKNAVVAETALGKIGMTICYDVRFAHLYRDLAKAGAAILTVPAAFSPVSGAAHWEVLLRARAIETGCYVLAPAQCGDHSISTGKPRRTHGHSLAVNPWGEVLVDGGAAPGLSFVEIDLAEVAAARRRIPSISHDRDYEGPA